jgi:hypothetical protein
MCSDKRIPLVLQLRLSQEDPMKACEMVMFVVITTTLAYARIYEDVMPGPEREEAQASESPQIKAETNSAGSFRPGSGTVIVAELSDSLDARKAKEGDQVKCEVVQDLVYTGRVIIPHGAKVLGHVSEASRSTKEQPQSRLGLVFERIVLKDKRELPFQYTAVIMAVAAPIKRTTGPTTQMNDLPVQMEKGRTTGGAAIDAVGANANLAGANMRLPGSGAIGGTNRGVIGIKGLALENTASGTTVIVSAKGDVKLVFETQMVLQVMDASHK